MKSLTRFICYCWMSTATGIIGLQIIHQGDHGVGTLFIIAAFGVPLIGAMAEKLVQWSRSRHGDS